MIIVPLRPNSNRENQFHSTYVDLKYSGIYIILNTYNKKYYIGSAINFLKRRIHHYDLLKENKHFNKHLQRAFNKYGEENFKFIVIEKDKLNKKVLEDKEALLIKTMMATNPEFGYNKSHRTSSRLGLKNSNYQRKRTIEVWTGRKHSEKSKEKMSNSKRLYYSLLKNNPCAVAIFQYDKNNILIKEYNSITIASKETNILGTSISNNLTNRSKTAGGFIWKYKF